MCTECSLYVHYIHTYIHACSSRHGLQFTIYSFTYLFLAEDGLQLLDVLCLECEELLGLGVEYELHLLVGKLVSNSIRWVYRKYGLGGKSNLPCRRLQHRAALVRASLSSRVAPCQAPQPKPPSHAETSQARPSSHHSRGPNQ